MILSKQVPATTITIEFEWCKKDFMPMSDAYRKARKRAGSPMDSCYWCRHKFENGEMIALAHAVKVGNKVLCQTCADELLRTS